MDTKTQEAVDEFIERMGLITQAEGLPRIAGRILATLTIYDEPFSFSQLSEMLAVSRGSISTNTRLLAQLGVIDRISKRGERQDYFVLKENPYQSLMQGVKSRVQDAQALLNTTQSKLPGNCEKAKARIAQMQDFYTSFERAIESLT